jgi:hypothetical protein
MPQHPLAMRDLSGTEPPGIGAVQAGRVRFETHPGIVEERQRGIAAAPAERETNDHEDDCIGTP